MAARYVLGAGAQDRTPAATACVSNCQRESQQFLKTRSAKVDTSSKPQTRRDKNRTTRALRHDMFTEERRMSEELQEMQRQIVSAVQQELTRFSGEVATNFAQVGEDMSAAGTARADLERQVQSLVASLEQSQAANAKYQADLQRVLEGRLTEFGTASKARHDEMNVRLGKVVDDANVGIGATVEAAARPILKQLEHRQDKVESDLVNLDGSIRRFDEQAGQMVSHINSVTAAIEARLEKVTADVNASFDDRFANVVMRIDEVSAVAARQQAEVANIVSTRVDASEERISERLRGLEGRINDEIGQRVADIDAHVGRIGAGLDEAVVTLNDRIAVTDGKFSDLERQLGQIRDDLSNLDTDAIDEMKDKISSALGQAELVRIEMDRFKVEIKESQDKTALRLTEVETTVQDQRMDVETAVQLERLEEVERAVLMLDPDILRSEPVMDSVPVYEQEPAVTYAPVAVAPEAAPQPVVEPQPAAAAPAKAVGIAPVEFNMGGVPPLAAAGSVAAPATAPLAPPTADPTINSFEDDATLAMTRPTVNS
jgi:hypothetical protein